MAVYQLFRTIDEDECDGPLILIAQESGECIEEVVSRLMEIACEDLNAIPAFSGQDIFPCGPIRLDEISPYHYQIDCNAVFEYEAVKVPYIVQEIP